MNDLFGIFLLFASILLLFTVGIYCEYSFNCKMIDKGYVWKPDTKGQWILPTQITKPEKDNDK